MAVVARTERKPTSRELFTIVFWVASALSTVSLTLAGVMVVVTHFGWAPYNALWLPSAAFLLPPSIGLWIAGWLLHTRGSPRR